MTTPHIPTEISQKKIVEIKSEIKSAAVNHLNSKDAATALSYYTDDATIASNGSIYGSFNEFARETEGFYGTLSTINLAIYDDMHIDVINANTAFLIAKFRWSSTDTAGVTINLKGVWSALFIRDDNRWKMKFRHESL